MMVVAKKVADFMGIFLLYHDIEKLWMISLFGVDDIR